MNAFEARSLEAEEVSRRERLALLDKAERVELEAHMQVAGEYPAGAGRMDLAARLFDDAAGYWEAVGGRSMEAGECRRLAQECRRKAEGR